MTVASGEINLQGKHDRICHVAKVKAATSANSMAGVINNANRDRQEVSFIISIMCIGVE